MEETDPLPSEPAVAAPPPNGLRRMLRWLTGGLLALIAVLALALLGLNTGPGRDFVARQISKTTLASGLRIGIGRIDGSLYGRVRLVDVVAYDTKGAFLRAPMIELDWRPLDYLRNHVDVRSATASLVVLARVPVFRAADSTGPLLPDLDIDIGRLQIDRLVSEPAVSGDLRALRLLGMARIADRRAQVSAHLATLAVQDNAGGDRLDLDLDAVPEANRLAFRLNLEAPRGGVIAAFAHLPAPLALKAGGSGDWASWNGTLAADLGGKTLARLALTARKGVFTARGPADPARLLGSTAATLLDQTTRVDLAAALDRRRATVSGRVGSQALAIVPGGVIDLSRNSFAGFNLDLRLLRPSALAPGLAARDVRAQLQFDGQFARPQVRYQLSAAAVTANGVELEGITAIGAARIGARQTLVPVSGRISRISGLDSAAGGTLANVRLDGDLALAGSRILSDNLRLRADRIDAKAILLADTARGYYSGSLEGRISSYVVDSVGVFAVNTAADLKRTDRGLALTGTIRARSTRLTNQALRDFLGGSAAGSTQVAYGTDGVLRFTRLRISSPQLQVFDGRGTYRSGGAIDFSATGRSTRYGPLAVDLTGTLAKPRAVLLAGSPGLGIGLADLRAEIIGDAPGYRLAARGRTDFGPLNADVSLIQGSKPALEVNHGDLAGIGFSGRIERTAAGPYAGEFRASGRGLAGVVRLDADGRYQEALINVRARDTILPGPAGLAIGNAIVDARVVLRDRPQVAADVQVAQTRVRGLDLGAARARLDYRDGRGQARFLIEAAGAVPFRLAGNALLEPGMWRASLDGRVRGIALRTASPARVAVSDAGYQLLPTTLDFGQGQVRLAGTYGNGLKLQTRLEQLDAALLNAFFPGYGIGGKVTGSLDFAQAGPDMFPSAEARLAISGFTRTTAASVSQPVDLDFAGSLAADRTQARAVIRRRGTIIGRLAATLKPLGPGGGDWTARVRGAPLEGGIRYSGPAETLWSFAGQPDQSLSGPIAVGADFSGRLGQPQLTGIVRAENLAYENQTYGTRLAGLAVTGRFSGDRLQIERLSAAAGSGTVTGQGFIGLAAEQGYPMDMAFTLDNARLARSDALSSAATGQLRLHKSADAAALLSGKLLLPETHYELVRQGAAEVPELTGVRFRPQQGRQRISGNEPAQASASLLGSLQLDIALTAPNRLFVTGMGLDSEWSANLHVGGTSSMPKLSGDIDLVRGNLGFAGRQFELGEGRLLFLDGAPGDPQIALNATENIDDIAVGITVSGRALNPQIGLTSTPALPSDEILARILFGNSVGQLSPVQAIQLAASLNSLRGSGGGLNPLGKLRAATGISRLRILNPDEATGRGTAFAAGRYITRNVYVELITDARGFTATQMEVSLDKTLSILSQAGGSGLTNVNLRFRKRY